jgi:lysophospholipid acyltransferase 1/2
LFLPPDDAFIDGNSIFYNFWYIMMCTTTVRFKYYFAWLLADAICNNAGLGFNGYESDGAPKWDLLTNIYVIHTEVSKKQKRNF